MPSVRAMEEQAWDEYLQAVLRGEPEDFEDFCDRHPEASDDLRRRIQALGHLLGRDPRPRASGESPSPEPGLPFETLGEYRLLQRIGEGGMGVVYLARQVSLGRLVALKVIRADRIRSPDAEARFRREAQAIAKLRHPNVITVFAIGEERGVHYLAMELVPGKALDEILREAESRGRPVPISQRLRWIAGIASALEAVHQAGLVHRDVKPGNIRITPDGGALLVDFGLVREADSDLTVSGEFRGTPSYASPEQVAGKRLPIDHRTDVYSLGCTLYECVTGRVPFDGETREQLFSQILTKDPPSPRRLNGSITRDLETVILRAMEKDPDKRYAGAAALADDLEALLEIRPIRARRAGVLERTLKWARRDPGTALAIATFLLAVLVTAGLALDRRLAVERAFRAEMQSAEVAAGRNEFDEALASLDRALGKRPDAESALRRRAEIVHEREGGLALAALAEVAPRLEEYRKKRSDLVPLRRRIQETRAKADTAPLSDEERASLAGDLDSLRRMSQESDDLYLVILDALNRAARHDPSGDRVNQSFAEVYLERWREALAAGDAVSEEAFREKVQQYDVEGRWQQELEGKGTIAIAGTPEGTEVFLFRFERQSVIKPGGESRLVPVPFQTYGGSLYPRLSERSVPAGTDIYPGDLAIAVEGVEPDSPGDEARVRRGDLVFHVAGVPVEEAIFALAIDANGPAGRAGVRPFDRLARLGGRAIRSEYAAEQGFAALRPGDLYDAVFLRGGLEVPVRGEKTGASLRADLGLSLLPATGALSGDHALPTEGMALRIWSRGSVREVRLGGGRPAGIRGSLTSTPLLCGSANFCGRLPDDVGPAEEPSGSYLLVFRKDGYEDLLVPVLLERQARFEVRADLLPAGGSPDGFVWIPEGPFAAGGDPEALGSWERKIRTLPGFWIARTEVTVGEYAEFLNDPATRAEIDQAAALGTQIRVPRTDDLPGGPWRIEEEGKYTPTQDPRWPVLGVSWEDADAYCRWRTESGRRRGEAWVYDLPTEEQWEKAARGVDGRAFPWGDEFEWIFCMSAWFPPEAKRPEPVGRHVRGVSPWGVLDLAGGAREWCRGWHEGETTRPSRGGAWVHGTVQPFRIAHRSGSESKYASFSTGFRLVARKE